VEKRRGWKVAQGLRQSFEGLHGEDGIGVVATSWWRYKVGIKKSRGEGSCPWCSKSNRGN